MNIKLLQGPIGQLFCPASSPVVALAIDQGGRQSGSQGYPVRPQRKQPPSRDLRSELALRLRGGAQQVWWLGRQVPHLQPQGNHRATTRQYNTIYKTSLDTNIVQYLIFINANNIFIWTGNPNNCLRLNRRPQAFFCLRRAFFKKTRFEVPKPCSRRTGGHRRVFCLLRHAFFQKGVFWSKTDNTRQSLRKFVEYMSSVHCSHLPKQNNI